MLSDRQLPVWLLKFDHFYISLIDLYQKIFISSGVLSSDSVWLDQIRLPFFLKATIQRYLLRSMMDCKSAVACI